MEKEKKPGKVKRVILIVVCVVLALLLAAVIAVTAFVEGLLGKVGRDPDATFETMSESEYNQMMEEEEATAGTDVEEMEPTDVVWDEESLLAQGDSIINIMLIGQDRRPGKKKNARSDAMILVTINKAKKTITLSSFMRDMYVQIPGKKDNRINASYVFGGIKLLNKTVEKNFGVKIHGNVVVDFSGFMDAIDVVGGVDIKLTAQEAKYLNNHSFADQKADVGNNFVAGVNHLDGSEALAYARTRKIGNGDFGRTARQRKVLMALLNKVRQMPLKDLNALLNQLLPLVTTDLTDAEILGYAMELLPILQYLDVKSQQIPAKGAYKHAKIGGKAVLVPNLKKNKAILQEIMATN